MSENVFEQAARAKKVAALVAYFDEFLTAAGLDPHSDALNMTQTLEAMKPRIWDSHAIVGAGLSRGPSETTRREVIAVYQGRVVAYEASLDKSKAQPEAARCSA